MPHPYEDVVSKIKRAEKHIADFIAETAGFMQPDPYGVIEETDPNTREKFHVIKTVPTIPRPLRIIAGDAIQNLRSALDYLAYGLVVVANAKPTHDTGYPISTGMPKPDDPNSRFSAQVRGMRQDAIDAIKATKPYKRGNYALWRLHRLNIIDKHRVLMAATTSASHINPRFSADLVDYLTGITDAIPNPATTMFDRFPVKAGDKFPFYASKTEMHKHEQFMLEIAFNEPGISEGEVVITVLKESIRCVQKIVGNLARFMY